MNTATLYILASTHCLLGDDLVTGIKQKIFVQNNFGVELDVSNILHIKLIANLYFDLQVAPLLELPFLLYISSDIILKLIWIKPKFTFKHRRTVFKVCVYSYV